MSGPDEREDLPGLSEAYRRTPAPGPEARVRLLERLDRAAPPRRGWLWVSGDGVLGMRPLAAATLAVVLLVGGYALSFVPLGARRVPAAAPAGRVSGERAAPSGEPVRVVEFVLVASRAARASVVGDFNDWDPARTPMRRDNPAGPWTARVALTEGRHVYAFIVDGERWTIDPTAPLVPADDFGAARSVLVVGGNGI
jgi:hypothetical protein